jgi:prepilin-type N-terminal cleavage/methylation domain-containing protein
MRRSEAGFTLTEMLVVLLIMAVLFTIAVSVFLGMRERASDGAAKSALRQALPAVHGFHADHDTWTGMTLAQLRNDYDRTLANLTIVSSDDDGYCLQSSVNDRVWFAAGPPLDISSTSCAA